jgi:CheY-like chemotaxis protein
VERACRSKKQPIMIVDDNQDFADSLKGLLEVEGYRAIALYSGEDALKDIETINPSLLFLDLIMPGIDGFAVVQRLRSQERWHNLPIVVLSGAEITNEQRQNLNKLTEEFIDKGHFSKELITSTIKKIVTPSYR